MYLVLAVGGLTVLEAVILALFVILFAWIAFSFASMLGGVIALVTRPDHPLGIDAEAAPARACDAHRAAVPDLQRRPGSRARARAGDRTSSSRRPARADRFDVFILSDTTDPDIFIAEEAAFLALRAAARRTRASIYRHRPKNDAKKAGNIAEWVQRFGGHYEHMIVLDADSLMTGETLVRLAAAMERNPDVGLIQTFPVMVNAVDAVRARAAVRRAALRAADRLRACLVARRRQQLLGPQRDHPHARLRRDAPACPC